MTLAPRAMESVPRNLPRSLRERIFPWHPRRRLPKTNGKIRRASSTFTYCRYHGHHRSAPRRPSAAGVEQQMHNAVFGHIRS